MSAVRWLVYGMEELGCPECRAFTWRRFGHISSPRVANEARLGC